MKVFITGIGGFIGSALARRLESRGHVVVGSSKRPGASVRHALGDAVDPKWLADADALVHAAWDLDPGASDRNRSGSVRWREAAAATRAHALFVSSYSAYPDFPSSYGRDKAEVEASFTGARAAIVRPALVAGNGGLFRELVQRVNGSRLSLLPDGGRPDVELVDVDDVCAAIELLLLRRAPGEHDLSAGRLPLADVCRAIASGLGRNGLNVVSIPTGPVLGALALCARLGVGTGFRERLLGFVENSRRRRTSGLAALLGRAPVSPRDSARARAAEIVGRSREGAAFV